MEEKLIKLMLEQFSEGEYDTIDEAISDIKETVEHLREDDIIEHIIDNNINSDDINNTSYFKLKVLEYKAEHSLHFSDFKEIIENNEEIKNEIKKSFELIQKKYDENVNREVSEDEPLFSITDEFETVIELLEKASNSNFDDFMDDDDIFWEMGDKEPDAVAYSDNQVLFNILINTIDSYIPIFHKMCPSVNSESSLLGVVVYKDDVW